MEASGRRAGEGSGLWASRGDGQESFYERDASRWLLAIFAEAGFFSVSMATRRPSPDSDGSPWLLTTLPSLRPAPRPSSNEREAFQQQWEAFQLTVGFFHWRSSQSVPEHSFETHPLSEENRHTSITCSLFYNSSRTVRAIKYCSKPESPSNLSTPLNHNYEVSFLLKDADCIKCSINCWMYEIHLSKCFCQFVQHNNVQFLVTWP